MNHIVAVDLGYGDSGKGTVVDWLCAQGPARTVVRFNGGAQAGHNVVTPGGRHHCFSQFGAGTFTPGVRTHLSRFMMVSPSALDLELRQLRAAGASDALERLTIDGDALLTTPYHEAANRAREQAREQDSGEGRHGSCGMGIGETAAYAIHAPHDAPRVRDCLSRSTLRRNLTALREHLADDLGVLAGPPVEDVCDVYQEFASAVTITSDRYLADLLRAGPAVFEGAQGVLLDESFGFQPYTTWSATTFTNAEILLTEAGASALRLGIIRAYATRHGPGPFVTEDPTLEAPEPHNTDGPWQGPFRRGHPDAVALRYAVTAAGGIDALAVTHLDTAKTLPLRLCTAYDLYGAQITDLTATIAGEASGDWLTALLLNARPVYEPTTQDWGRILAAVADAPLALRSYGPTAADKQGISLLTAAYA